MLRQDVAILRLGKEHRMTYLDFPKMLSNFWQRPINPYEPDGARGEDDQPAKES